MNGGKIFITGASAGIGQALAEAFAAPGITLGLLARRLERLEALRQSLETRGANVHTYRGDVRDAEGMAGAIEDFIRRAGGVTHVVANSGIRSGGHVAKGRAGPLSECIAVNVQGVIHTLVPAVPHMIEQGGGHLITIGSVSGFRGLPGRSDYNASKAAVKILMDGMRIELQRHGIDVTTVCPGFVASEMTDRNRFHMPFFMQADKAAKLILRAVRRRKKTYIFPWQWRLMLPLIVWAPDWMMPQYHRHAPMPRNH